MLKIDRNIAFDECASFQERQVHRARFAFEIALVSCCRKRQRRWWTTLASFSGENGCISGIHQGCEASGCQGTLLAKNDIVCVRRSRVLPRNASIDRIGVANLLELQNADNRSEQ